MLQPFNSKLALAIPTYNRAIVLEQNLRRMLPELKKFKIPVYISDDSTNFETKELISFLGKDYPYLFYRHNDTRLGHDDNFFSTLRMPDTDYVWYLGDSVFVKPDGFRVVISALESNPDFCFVNAYVKSRQNMHVSPAQVHDFLVNHTWYLTLSGATIYGRHSRELSILEGRKGQWKNFPQLGLLLEYCGLHGASCEWLAAPLIEINQAKQSYWEKQAFSVFVRDWSVLIRSFPSLFNKVETNKIIRSHSKEKGLFEIAGLVRLRAMNVLNHDVLNEYEEEFCYASDHIKWARFLCNVPVSVCCRVLSLGKLLKQLCKVIR